MWSSSLTSCMVTDEEHHPIISASKHSERHFVQDFWATPELGNLECIGDLDCPSTGKDTPVKKSAMHKAHVETVHNSQKGITLAYSSEKQRGKWIAGIIPATHPSWILLWSECVEL